MAFQDGLRGWMKVLESEGELKEITAEVDWNLEMAGIMWRTCEEHGPALLFTNIKDHRHTLCTKFISGALHTYRHVALMMGLPKETPPKELILEYRRRTEKLAPPEIVEYGPVKENIIRRQDVDLWQFPVPFWHALDGGRYLNTYCGTVTQDPDNGWINVGMYRGMVHDDGKSIGVLLSMGSHWGQMCQKYHERGQAMPVAVVYGWEPVMPLAAAALFPRNVSEYDVMGAVRQKPVELVKCETNDLLVPATAEIVIEGTVSLDPSTFRMEGPFGEYPCYYGGTPAPKPVLQVDCITHRTDPILQGSLEGAPYDDGAVAQSITKSAYMWNNLDRNIPGILDVWCSPITHGTDCYVSIKKTYQGQAKQVAACIWGSTGAIYSAKIVMVVDDDIDIRNLEDIQWALNYRVWDPDEDFSFFRGCPGSMLDPSVPPELKDATKFGAVGRWHRLCIDATKDWRLTRIEHWGDRFPPRTLPTRQITELVNRRWKEYGLG